jgi:hypothetical protein
MRVGKEPVKLAHPALAHLGGDAIVTRRATDAAALFWQIQPPYFTAILRQVPDMLVS